MPNSCTSTHPRLYAHRGSSLLAPENTVAAFDLAQQYQCDVLEIDVRLSRDGHVMVTHDESLERTTNGSGLVRNKTIAQLQGLDAGCRFYDLNNEPYNGSRLMLLSLPELFEQYPTVGINIDIKDNLPEAADAVANIVAPHVHSRWINVASFHASVIKRFRLLQPNISTAATRQEVARLFFMGESAKDDYQMLQIPTSYCGIKLDGKRFIHRAQRAQKQIVHWTINEQTKMRQLLANGNNGVVTDRPDLALPIFKQLGFKK